MSTLASCLPLRPGKCHYFNIVEIPGTCDPPGFEGPGLKLTDNRHLITSICTIKLINPFYNRYETSLTVPFVSIYYTVSLCSKTGTLDNTGTRDGADRGHFDQHPADRSEFQNELVGRPCLAILLSKCCDSAD